MNATLLAPAASSPSWLRPLWRSSPSLVGSAAVLGVLAVVCLVGLAADPRTLGGLPVWTKPLKFCISGVLYVIGLAVLMRPLRGRWVRGLVEWGIAGIIVAETVLIAIQAARGVPSHFNASTALDGLVFASMGVMIATLTGLTVLAAVALLLTKSADRLWKQATLWGLALTLAGGSVGALMTQPLPEQIVAFEAGTGTTIGAHTVGAPDGGPGLPFLGWSTVGGDLRVPHFWGLHGLQALPLLALGLMRVPALTGRQRRRLLAIGGLGYAGVLGVLLRQALVGQPLIAPDASTTALFAGVVALCAAASLLVLRRRRA